MPRPNDPNDPISKLKEFEAIGVDKGSVTEIRRVQPKLEFRPCEFALCVGDRVFFPQASTTLSPEEAKQMLRWVVWMKRYPGDTLEIEGHADKTEEDALRLSEERARYAKQYLIEQGVEDYRLKVTAHGNARPVALGSSEEAATQNRRAVAIPHAR